jgi:hypothetical protein
MTYDTAALSTLLTDAFDAETFDRFCHAYFPQVADAFDGDMPHAERVQQLLEYCLQHEQVETLLHYVSQENPAEYRTYLAKFAWRFGSLPEEEKPRSYLERHPWLRVLILVVVLLFLAAEVVFGLRAIVPPATVTEQQVSGYVLDAKGDPLSGAKVTVGTARQGRQTVYTDAEGRYEFVVWFEDDVVNVRLWITASGYETYDKVIPLLPGTTHMQVIRMELAEGVDIACCVGSRAGFTAKTQRRKERRVSGQGGGSPPLDLV